MSTITAAEFAALSTLEQQRVIASTRAGRTNLACLKSIFGDAVPPSATAFHTADGKAHFINSDGPEWPASVAEIELTDDTSHALALVGMCGTLGWELDRRGNLGRLVEQQASKS